MVRTVRGSITIEQRQQVAAALTTPSGGIDGVGEWEQFLAFAGAFRSYSLSNVLLIL